MSSWFVRRRVLGALAGVSLGLVSSVRAQSTGVESVHHLTASAFPGVHAWAAGRPRLDEDGAGIVGGVIVLSLRGGSAPRDVTLWARAGNVSFVDVLPLVGLAEPEVALQRNRAERKVLEQLHDETRICDVLAQAWALPFAPARDPAALWPLLAARAEQQGARHAKMRLTVTPGAEPRVIGYLVELPRAWHGRFETEALAAFDDAMPERLVIKADVPPPDVTFKARLIDWFAGSLGVVGGAILGFGGFWLQQWYSRRVEIEKQFEVDKIRTSKALRAFFIRNGPYEILRDADGDEAARVRNVRDAFVDDGVYAILPARVAAQLNALTSASNGRRSRIARMNDLVSKHFAEFRS